MAPRSQILAEISSSFKPLIFFDDDADGLSSFLLLYKHIREGTGVIIKTTPRIDARFLPKVEEHSPDRIFILDIAELAQEFVDSCKVKVVWIDHHHPLDIKGVTYWNPRNHGTYAPTSYLVHSAIKENDWIAMVGCIGDWFIPDWKDRFIDAYPDLLPVGITEPDAALHTTRIGLLARIFSFVLKGTTKDAMTCVKIMSRIKDPYEILDQTTSQGKYIWKRYQKINSLYEELVQQIQPSDGRILHHVFQGDTMSFTSDLSNEMLFRHPGKAIVIGREKNGEVKLSFRAKDVNILKAAGDAMAGTKGFVGGHDQACGGMVPKQDFEGFLKKLDLVLSSKEI